MRLSWPFWEMEKACGLPLTFPMKISYGNGRRGR